MDDCIAFGVNYYTFNIPVTECKDCGHVVNAPVSVCPKCGSAHLDYWIRIIGFLRPLSAYSDARFKDAKKRILTDSKGKNRTLNDTVA